MVHVRVVTGTVHHRAGPKEHVRLKETVGEQVENRQSRTSRSQTCSQHHVADLAHRRSGEDLLDVLLRRTDPGAEQQGNGADDRHCQRGCTRVGIDLVRTYHQVNTSGNHRRSVDQGRDRRRALHGIKQPGLQRHLSGLTTSSQQQHETEQRGPG